jgi:hypothetical protein
MNIDPACFFSGNYGDSLRANADYNSKETLDVFP